MTENNPFIDGLSVAKPHANAPEFVKASLSINNQKLIDFLQERITFGDDWTNADIKLSKQDKLYIQINTWKKDDNTTQAPQEPQEKVIDYGEPEVLPPTPSDEIDPADIPQGW